MAKHPIIIAPSIVRCSFQGFCAGARRWANVEDFSVEGTASRLDLIQDFVNSATGFFQTRFMPVMGTATTFLGMHWLDIDSLDGQSGFVPPQAGHPSTGQGAGAETSQQVSYLIKKQCIHSRRQKNGRLYLYGVTESNVDNAGAVSTTAQTAITAAANGFRNDITSLDQVAPLASYAWRVVHVKGHDLVSGDPNEWESSDVDNCVCDPQVATQRRRLRG